MRTSVERFWPASLIGRVALILVLALVAALLAGLAMQMYERSLLLEAMQARPGGPPYGARHGGGPMPGMGMGMGMGHGPWAYPVRLLLWASLVGGVVVAVALWVVRWVTRPLHDLALAAHAFAHDLDAAPLPETGPSEVRHAAAAFNAMQQRLRGLVAERSRTLAAVSHDLRTPLTRLRLRAELVGDPSLQGKLNSDIDTMESMVNSVLDYLRGLEDHEARQNVDVQALLDAVAEDEQALGHAVKHVPAPAPWRPATLHAAKLLVLRRALGNLVDNAAAHAQQVQIWAGQDDRHWCIAVEDDGPGIPQADLARATEAWVRLDPERRVGPGAGVGLGLAIVRDAAILHGGTLTLDNRAGGGLRAALLLPRAPTPS